MISFEITALFWNRDLLKSWPVATPFRIYFRINKIVDYFLCYFFTNLSVHPFSQFNLIHPHQEFLFVSPVSFDFLFLFYFCVIQSLINLLFEFLLEVSNRIWFDWKFQVCIFLNRTWKSFLEGGLILKSKRINFTLKKCLEIKFTKHWL